MTYVEGKSVITLTGNVCVSDIESMPVRLLPRIPLNGLLTIWFVTKC
jgi:hypothetical protein